MSLSRLFLFSVFIVAPAWLIAEPTSIRGTVSGGEGLKIELVVLSDYFTNTERTIQESKIGSNGTFEIKVTITTTMFAHLKVGVQRCEIFIEPGKRYELKVNGLLDEKLRGKDIAPFQIPTLNLIITEPWRFELNGLVAEFLNFHEDFLAEHVLALVRQRDQKIVKQYITEAYNRFPGIDNAWFNDFITYKIATIEMLAKSGSREVLAGKYLSGKPILYNHMAYMDFYQQYFEKYLVVSRLYERQDLVAALDASNAMDRMMDLLRKDVVLSDVQLRELSLIKGMQDLASIPGYNIQAILALLGQVRTQSKYSEHRLIAENLSVQILNR